MNHTPNYQLSQWEKDDRVLMEDFNADNAKIDAAIANKSAFTLLKQATGGGSSVWLSLTNVDFLRYKLLLLEVEIPRSTTATVRITSNVLCSNRIPGVTDRVTTGLCPIDKHFSMHILIPVLSGGDAWGACYGVSNTGLFSSLIEAPLKNIESMNLSTASGSMPEGTEISLWGIF